MATLQDVAHRIADSLRSGNLQEAERHIDELQRLIPLCVFFEERCAAAAIVLEARTLALVHRAQTAQSLHALAREGHYHLESGEAIGTFELEA